MSYMNIKRNARKSLSIPNKPSLMTVSTDKPIIQYLRSQEIGTDEKIVCPSISSDYEVSTDDDGWEVDASVEQMRSYEAATDDDVWETDASVEQMRSSDFVSIREVEIHRPMSYVSDSLPFNRIDAEPLLIPDLSFLKEIDREKDTLQNTITSLVISPIDDFKTAEDDYSFVEDDECKDNNSFAATDFGVSTDSPHERQKHKSLGEYSFEDKNNDKIGDNFGEAQNIQDDTSLKKENIYRGIVVKNTSPIHRPVYIIEGGNSFEVITEDRFGNHQNIQNEELQENKEKNCPTEIATCKRNTYQDIGHDNICGSLQNSNLLRREHESGIKKPFKGAGDCNDRESFREAQNVHNDTFKKNKTSFGGFVGKTKMWLNRLKKADDNMEISKNSTDQEEFKNSQIIQTEEKNHSTLSHTTTLEERESDISSLPDVFSIGSSESFRWAVPKYSSTLKTNVSAPLGDTITYLETSQSYSFKTTEETDESNIARDKCNSFLSFETTGFSVSTYSPKQRQKPTGKIEYSFEGGCKSRNNFEETQSFKIEKKKRMLSKGITIKNIIPQNAARKRERVNKKRHSFKNINQSYTEGRFEHFQDIQNEELQKEEKTNNLTEIKTSRRKSFKGSGRDITCSQSTNTPRKSKKHVFKARSSFIQADDSNRKDIFQKDHKIVREISKKKKSPYRVVANRTKKRINKSTKSATSLRRSKNNVDLKFLENLHNGSNEEAENNWPICCLTTPRKTQFNILEPVMRYDLPIDTITMMCLEKDSKKKCPH